jgi:hypothetical protein
LALSIAGRHTSKCDKFCPVQAVGGCPKPDAVVS